MDRQDMASSIDLLDNCASRHTKFADGVMAVSWRRNSIHRSSAVFEDSEWTGFFSGDLVDYAEVPWALIIQCLRNGTFEPLNQLIGVFTIAVLNEVDRKLWLITDQIGQAPLFVGNAGASIVFSTSIATFCRLREPPRIDRKWVFESMYFNYPVGTTSLLEGVHRVPAASIVEIDIDKRAFATIQFGGAQRYVDTAGRFDRDEQLHRASEVFADRIPRYFVTGEKQAVSLTAGLDSQTVLSFAPSNIDPLIETYTYGMPGCEDLTEAAKIAGELGLPHRQILFDDQCVSQLDEAADESIFLSGGLQKTARATLLHVYRALTNNGTQYPVVISGISGDHVFRDHLMGNGNVPHMISSDMMKSIQSGSVSISEDHHARVFGTHFAEFRDYIHSVIKGLSEELGDLTGPAAYLRFLLFEVGPRYFAGESALASHFTALRSPYWDSHLHMLAFELDYSTAGFSRMFSERKDVYKECVLQARMISQNGKRRIRRVKGLPISAYACDNRAIFWPAKFAVRLPMRMARMAKGHRYVPLEDWQGWLDGVLRDKSERLLSQDALIHEHIEPDFVAAVQRSTDVTMRSKLMTMETILRLAANGWKRLPAGIF